MTLDDRETRPARPPLRAVKLTPDIAETNRELANALSRVRGCVTGIAVMYEEWPREWPLLGAECVLRDLHERITVDPLASEVLAAIDFLLSQVADSAADDWLRGMYGMVHARMNPSYPGRRLSELMTENIDSQAVRCRLIG